jgi:hypothetical protein
MMFSTVTLLEEIAWFINLSVLVKGFFLLLFLGISQLA